MPLPDTILYMKCQSILNRGRDLATAGQLRDAISLFVEASSLIETSFEGKIHGVSPAESQIKRDLRKCLDDLKLDLAMAFCSAQRYDESLQLSAPRPSLNENLNAWALARGEALVGLKRFNEAARAFSGALDVKRTRSAVLRMSETELGVEMISEAIKRIDDLDLSLSLSGALIESMKEELAERHKDKEQRNASEMLILWMIEDRGNATLACEAKILMSRILTRAGRPRTASKLAALSVTELVPIMQESFDPETAERCLILLASANFVTGLAASKAALLITNPGEKELILAAAARSLARSAEINPQPTLYHSTLCEVVSSLALECGDGMKAAQMVREARRDLFSIEPCLMRLSPELTEEPEDAQIPAEMYRLVYSSGRLYESKAGPKHPFALSRVYYDSKQLPGGEEIPWIELGDKSCSGGSGVRWRQTGSAVSAIVLGLPKGTKGRDLVVTITSNQLTVMCCKDEGRILFAGRLSKAINPSLSSWFLDKYHLVFDLHKSNLELWRGGSPASTWWDRLFDTHPPISFDDQERDYSDLPHHHHVKGRDT